ncbi:apolipoprotein A-II [Danio aesculapii]|uniref:apolipoprotein A-II n=1 Tax=Danio aesculapii TaxID=1142201 RepID=UPI0024C0DA99|nr:apolipoprotein A-II [Danio aesculapii]
MKLTFALILALQVSVCVWAQEWPVPDKELVDKYEGLRTVFIKRLVNAWEKVKTAVEPALEGSPTAGGLKEVMEELKKSPRVESFIKIAGGLASELNPVVDKARLNALGVYGQYLRPYIGEHLDKAINNIKPVLDTVLPQEN